MISLAERAWSRLRVRRSRARVAQLSSRLGRCGSRTLLPSDGVFIAPERIFIGDDVLIGSGAWMSAVNARIEIGRWVMFAPRVAVVAGNHNTSLVGEPMRYVEAKRPGDDMPVIIEEEVWVGYGVVILKGVRIGRGSIVSAGAVVTRDVSPYRIVGGVPARVLGRRFSREEVVVHETRLYGRLLTDFDELDTK